MQLLRYFMQFYLLVYVFLCNFALDNKTNNNIFWEYENQNE